MSRVAGSFSGGTIRVRSDALAGRTGPTLGFAPRLGDPPMG